MQIVTYRDLLDFVRRNELWQQLARPVEDSTVGEMQWYAHTAFLDILLSNPELRALVAERHREIYGADGYENLYDADLYEVLFEDTATVTIGGVLYTEDWPGDVQQPA